MTSQQVGLLVNVGIYVCLVAFILYREMSEHRLRPARLVVPPAVLALFAVQQLSRQHLSTDLTTIGLLGLNLAIGVLAGVWRGTTFRIWSDAGTVVTKGTGATLVSWAALIAVRLPFVVVSHTAKLAVGIGIGELLAGLAATFAAQNMVLWLRSAHAPAMPGSVG